MPGITNAMIAAQNARAAGKASSTSTTKTASSSSLPTGASTSTTVATLTSGQMRFPYDLEKQPFWMSFSFYQYNMPSLTQQNVYYKDTGTIRLPLPNSMVDSQHVQYSAESLNLLTGVAVNQIQGGNAGAGFAALGAQALAPGIVNPAINAVQSQAAQAGLQSQGAALNPFLTVMFKQPAFKMHSLEWKLSPSNETESQQLNQIINTFRANMLPDKNNALGGSLLTYPNIVQISVSVNNGGYFTYVFKPAVIESFDINFAPSGQPSFFGSSVSPAPTEVQIRLGVMEIEYWLSSDFGLNGRTVDLSTLGSSLGNALKSIF
jgi:hypothetical protein